MRRVPVIALLALVTLTVGGCFATSTSSSGIGYPAGPSLAQFGLRERCPQGGDCSERAMEAVEAALGRLGAPIEDTAITTTGGPTSPDRLVVEVSGDPPLAWRSEGGAEGSGSVVRVDLTDGDPYVVVAPRQAFRISGEDAAAILGALFVRR